MLFSHSLLDQMAPRGATHRYVTPGLHPLALITGSFFLMMVLQCTHSLPTRTERLISENDRYYWVERTYDRIRCLLCPEGTYVKEDCTTEDTLGTCETCPEGTYLEFSSGLSECFICSRCRDDQDEVTSCSIIKNTDCQCKKGTFCPPDQPCEICILDTNRHLEDQVVNDPCNSTLDMLCTNPGLSTGLSIGIIIAIVAASLVLLIIIVSVGIYIRRHGIPTQVRNSLEKLTAQSGKGNDSEEANVNLLKKSVQLQFKVGIDKDTKEEIIAKSCAIIVQSVPIGKFENLMHCLGVTHNEIERAKMDNPNHTYNQCSGMLQAWYQRKGFQVNLLLQALQGLSMEQAALDITEKLIKDDLFVPQTLQNSNA